jgi:hypothetical protein
MSYKISPKSLEYNKKYQNGIIYKIYCKKNPYKVYIGSTYLPLSVRFKGHKHDSTFSSKLFNEFGYENCIIEVVVPFPCDTKYQLDQHEMIWIIHFSNLDGYTCVNRAHNKHLSGFKPITRREFLKQRNYSIHRELNREIDRRYNKRTEKLYFDYVVDKTGKANVVFVWTGGRNTNEQTTRRFYFMRSMKYDIDRYRTKSDWSDLVKTYDENKYMIKLDP